MTGEAFLELSDSCSHVENTAFLVNVSLTQTMKKVIKCVHRPYSFNQQSGRAMTTT